MNENKNNSGKSFEKSIESLYETDEEERKEADDKKEEEAKKGDKK